MAPKKYYVVWIGRSPGIYATWSECREQVHNYKDARYKAFLGLEEAREAFSEGWQKHYRRGSNVKKMPLTGSGPVPDSISVDAACSGNPGPTEYRGVHTKSGDPLFEGRLRFATNNIGEFLAIVEALRILKGKRSDMPIYSDSGTAITWVRKKRCNTALRGSASTKEAFERIEGAERWLEENDYPNPILKWDTRRWGEIPADYGRK
ncbi:MAG: ribonuclease H family protein [Candidatus Thermoplasmatota archaeon]|nr:ribonuclease H family protein [Candidatus Thermoplasmatota archaeon]